MYDRAIHTQVTRELRREQVATLLARYPGITPEESREILSFIRTGRHMDVGLLLRDERLRTRLDAFMQQHLPHAGRLWGDLATAAAAAAVLALLLMG